MSKHAIRTIVAAAALVAAVLMLGSGCDMPGGSGAWPGFQNNGSNPQRVMQGDDARTAVPNGGWTIVLRISTARRAMPRPSS